MLRINDAPHFRRTVAGICLIAAPLTVGASDVLRITVEGAFDGATAEGLEQILTNIAARPGLYQVVLYLSLLGVIVFVPAVLGLMHLLSDRGVVLGHVGGGLALLGLLGAAAHNVGWNQYNAAAAALTGDRSQVVEFHNVLAFSVPSLVVIAMLVIGLMLGLILLAVGTARARLAPRWVPAVVVAAVVAGFVAGDGVVGIATTHTLFTIGLGAVGLRVLRMSDADWARTPAPVDSPHQTTVAVA